MFHRLSLVVAVLFTCLPLSFAASPNLNSQAQQKQSKTSKTKSEEAHAEAAQRRTVAISIITSLADEARNFKDQTRRARVQARAADVLWDSDPERARELFHRAWEAAQTADEDSARMRAEELRKQQASGGRPVVVRGGPDIRSEVLRIAAKRDRKLGEEFLKILDESEEKLRADNAAELRRSGPAGMMGASKRLQLARRLVEEGQVERGMGVAAPALDSVNLDSIFFLSALREKNAEAADAAYTTLMARVVRDAASDANTVSGLSSSILTPFFYVSFEPSGGSNQNRGRGPTPPPNIDAALRSNFLKVSYQILMQPQPAPDQDRSTSGSTGKYLVIKRLLPVFEEYSPDLAPGLRTQMTALASFVPSSFQQGENRAVTAGIVPESNDRDPQQEMQERLDRAKTSEDRDAIYADYAVALSEAGNNKARELVEKIEETELRKNVKAFVDFQLANSALKNKNFTEATRLAANGELSSIQKVWIYTSASKALATSERSHAIDLLEEAFNESRRISGSDPDRARGLTAVAARQADLDPVRAWETLSDVVKAANGAEAFTGEDSRISARIQTKFMVEMTNATAEDFDLLAVFRPLARADLFRAVQVAKTFTGEAPRAVATLAIARSVLETNRTPLASTPN